MNPKSKTYFVQILLEWNRKYNKRSMPWKGEKDAYKIWLSEIILQQTRVEQGTNYYNRFIEKYPTIIDLAKEKDTAIFKLWEGLGYYNRCKNLLVTARLIAKERKGIFPETYTEILQLKGIGPYTAAAISSFAYKLPHAVVDGNVYRILSRYFGIKIPVDSSEGKSFFSELANELIDKKEPGIFNQAIMDFGATVCTPQTPICTQCPFQKNCKAFLNNLVTELPVKNKKVKSKERFFVYLVLEYRDKWYVRKRADNDIWQNLYEFVLYEGKSQTPINQPIKKIMRDMDYDVLDISKQYSQKLSHQTISSRFAFIKIKEKMKLDGYDLISRKALKTLPFPKIINAYLEDINNPNKD